MKKQDYDQEIEITGIRSFIRMWSNCLKLRDSNFYNILAYLILANILVIIYGVIKIINIVTI